MKYNVGDIIKWKDGDDRLYLVTEIYMYDDDDEDDSIVGHKRYRFRPINKLSYETNFSCDLVDEQAYLVQSGKR